jgi:hypothetical protein
MLRVPNRRHRFSHCGGAPKELRVQAVVTYIPAGCSKAPVLSLTPIGHYAAVHSDSSSAFNVPKALLSC